MIKILITDREGLTQNLASWELVEAIKDSLKRKCGAGECHVAVIERYSAEKRNGSCSWRDY